MKLTIQTFLTLDGVMQAPGGPDEDTDRGFPHGGWGFPYGDEDFGASVVNWMSQADGVLLGRKTYDIFASYWPKQTDPADPVATALNTLPKYVASTTLSSADWQNTTILSGDVVAEVAKLKERPGRELQVHGSGQLAQTLIDADLIDEYLLYYHPVHLGTGKKLFRDGAPARSLKLMDSRTTGAGVIIARYQPDGPVRYGSYADEGA
jgi:dihydrofolate reductase